MPLLPQTKYELEVKICSETIFDSGEKERNLVQSRVLTDRYGFVYFHAKSLKGQLKRQAFWLLEQYRSFDRARAASFLHSLVQLFGMNREELKLHAAEQMEMYPATCQGILRLGHLELDERIRKYFMALQAEDVRKGYCSISPHDLIEAQTHIRTSIQLEQGVVKDKRLTSYHTVRKGLLFYSPLSFTANAADYLGDLQRIVYSLSRIGAGIHRGRGEVKTRLLTNGKEVNYLGDSGKDGERNAMLSSY